jgi:RecB family exonuclease
MLSPTAVATFRRCPLQWWYRYVAGIPTKPTASLVRGLAVHRAAQRALEAKLSGELVSEDVAAQVAATEADQLCQQAYFEETERPDVVREEAERLARVYVRQVLPERQPRYVELRTRAELGGYRLEVVVDLVEQDGTITDLKVRSAKDSGDSLAVDYQLAVYTAAAEGLGLTVRAVRQDQLVATRQPYHHAVELPRKAVDLGRAAAVTAAVAEAMSHRKVWPTDDQRVCSWCPYRPMCWGQPWESWLANPEMARRAAESLMPDRVDRADDVPV